MVQVDRMVLAGRVVLVGRMVLAGRTARGRGEVVVGAPGRKAGRGGYRLGRPTARIRRSRRVARPGARPLESRDHLTYTNPGMWPRFTRTFVSALPRPARVISLFTADLEGARTGIRRLP